MVQKIYKKLLKEQKERSVIFSSCLSVDKYEHDEDTLHEVFKTNEDEYKEKPAYELKNAIEEQETKIRRLKDDKFFNESHYNYNIIRRG